MTTDEAIKAAAEVIRPLFRHGGGGGATGISYAWNNNEGGYGIWSHETGDWFPDQPFPKRLREIDGPSYFARRALLATGFINP